MAEYIIRVVRLTASKFRFDVSSGDSLLYVFSSEDPLDALRRILTFFYFFRMSHDVSLDDFVLKKTAMNINYVVLFSCVERDRVMSFYV